MATLLRGRVITPTEEIADGVVVLEAETIAWVGSADQLPQTWAGELPPSSPNVILPGLVDVHNHGGGGESFPDSTSAEAARVAVGEHRRHGTTRMLASLVTAAPEVLLERAATLKELISAGEIEGVHSEGPFLSEIRCGAQNPAFLTEGNPELVRSLIELLEGRLVSMTVAPDVAGCDEVVTALVDGGALPSFGHTDAAADVMTIAIERASSLLDGYDRRPTITHLFNGMRTIHHREPGPVPPSLAAAARGELMVELVGDGAHLHPDLVRDVFSLVGADNIALITDSMAAAGMADGDYRLGSLDVTVVDGVARLTGGTSIAGGTAHLIDVVRTTAGGGVPLVEAVRAASLTPARAISSVIGGRPFGALVSGYRGDAVVADAQLAPVEVYRDGARLSF